LNGHFSNKPTMLRGLFCALFALGAFTASAAIHYVKVGGSGTGTSWANASGDLQAVINAAVAGDEIWVAAGTYKPSVQHGGGTDRDKTFFIDKDIKIYGGFAGSETQRAQRNWTNNPTVLSGDLGTPNDNTDNALHVVWIHHCSSAMVLDGFTLEKGNANGEGAPGGYGGGIYNEGNGAGNSSNPSVANCKFSKNLGKFGGGMYNNGDYEGASSPSLNNCVFTENSVGSSGGALMNSGYSGTSSPQITNCTFSKNSAEFGGGIYNLGRFGGTSAPKITNCSFLENSAEIGGGMAGDGSFGGISPELTGCIFEDNTATWGGGISNYAVTNAVNVSTFVNCSFTGNTATNYGGGIFDYTQTGGSNTNTLTGCSFIGNSGGASGGGIFGNTALGSAYSTTLTNCIFSGNLAGAGGGMGHSTGGSSHSAILYNCVFSGNSATSGGGIYNDGRFSTTSSSTLTNCSFSGNKAGALYSNGATAVATNCIFWGNSTEIENHNGGSASITRSIVQGGYAGTGNWDVNPFFVSQPDFNTAPTTTGDLRLQACSPALDAGLDANNSTTTDLDGNARKFNAIPGGQQIDMGAYEHQTAVSTGIWHVNAATSTPGSGISWDCSMKDLQQALAVAAAGDKIWVAAGTYKPTTGTDRAISFVMKNGVDILGGFPTSGDPDLSDRDWAANPTILSGDIGTMGDNSDNSYHVISNYENGLDNSAVLDGFTITGGYSADKSFPDYLGGGMSNYSSSPLVRNCTFSNNTAIVGGGISNFYAASSVINCVFRDNSAHSGGGISNFFDSPLVANCTFYGNSAIYGGGIYNTNGTPILTNCTLSDNSSANNGGGILNENAPATITNCIVWGNDTGISDLISTSNVTYSIVQDAPIGTGNLDTDPLFVDAANNNFRLQACSQAIDAGTDAANATTTDLDGNARKFDAIPGGRQIDMGAYEYQNNLTTLTALCQNITIYLEPSSQTITVDDIDNGSITYCGAVFTLNGQSSLTFDCDDLGQQIVTLSAQQGSQSASCQATVTVVDNLAPTAVCQNTSVNLSAAGTASIAPAAVFASGTDNCGTVNPQSVSPNAFTCSNLGANTVTLTINDGNDNTNTCTAVVTVADKMPPSVVCKNASVNLSAAGTASITPADVFASGTDNCGTVNLQSVSPSTFSCGNLGANTVTLTVNDGNSNTATCTATVTVVDNIPPTVMCKNISVNLSAYGTAGIAAGNVFASGTDNCGIVSPQSVSPNAFFCGNLGANTVTLTVNDGNGNTATCTATVTVSDAQPPAITCPANIVRGTDAGQCSAVVTYATPTATDNCGVTSVTLHSAASTASGSVFPKGTTVVVWKATDTATPTANTSTCSFTVTVNDAQLPSITCPSNIVKANDTGQCSAVVTYTAPTASDNCAGVTTALHSAANTASGSVFPKGQTTVAWRATDAAGLTKTCTFRITVNDSENPAITCPTVAPTTTTANSCASAPLTYATPTATDNCTGVTVLRISGPASGSNFPAGTTNVTWRAIDGAGRSSTCSFAVTVTDATAPTISCPQSVTVTGGGSPCAASVGYATPTATDNCGVQSVSLLSGQPSGSSFPAGVTSVIWRAVDNVGNSATCSFVVTVGCGASPDPSEGGENVAAERDVEGDVSSPPLRGGWVGLVVSPNPASERVTIFAENMGEAGGEMTVWDAQGRLVWQQRVGSETLTSIDLDDRWPSGVYSVVLRSAGQTATKRLVVARL